MSETNETQQRPKTDEFADRVSKILSDIEAMLVAKNRAYGNSALDPVRVFSESDTVEQLRVRIDDKLSRIQRGTDFKSEDTIDDLIGYFVLLKIALRDKVRNQVETGKPATGGTFAEPKINFAQTVPAKASPVYIYNNPSGATQVTTF